jgi:uncharacterized membrane protein
MMKRLLSFLSTSFIGGLLVILPLWLTILIIGAAISALRGALHPIGGWLVDGSAHPDLVAALILVLLCFLAGAFLQTRLASSIGSAMDGTIFSAVPGYRLIRRLLRRDEHDQRWAVALVQFDDATVSGFVVEELPDGQYAVFVPSVPTPAAGSVYIMEAHRVHIVDVPFAQALRCVAQWGAGSSSLMTAFKANKARGAG